LFNVTCLLEFTHDFRWIPGPHKTSGCEPRYPSKAMGELKETGDIEQKIQNEEKLNNRYNTEN
jgi:hypothetical protein